MFKVKPSEVNVFIIIWPYKQAMIYNYYNLLAYIYLEKSIAGITLEHRQGSYLGLSDNIDLSMIAIFFGDRDNDYK